MPIENNPKTYHKMLIDWIWAEMTAITFFGYWSWKFNIQSLYFPIHLKNPKFDIILTHFLDDESYHVGEPEVSIKETGYVVVNESGYVDEGEISIQEMKERNPKQEFQEMQESGDNGEEAEVSIQETDAELQDSYYGEEEPEPDENDQYHKEMWTYSPI